MKRYEYLKKKCRPISFYDCLGYKLGHQESCKLNGAPCSPISIPDKEIPICVKNATSEYQYIPDTETQQCNEYEVVEEAMYKCMGQMPCNTEEYITDEYKAGFFSPIKRIILGNTFWTNAGFFIGRFYGG